MGTYWQCRVSQPCRASWEAGQWGEGLTPIATTVQPTSKSGSDARRQQQQQIELQNQRVDDLFRSFQTDTKEREENSPLAVLLRLLWESLTRLSGATDEALFGQWLETSVRDPIHYERAGLSDEGVAGLALDTLDGILTESISIVESLATSELDGTDIDRKLKAVWSNTSAAIVSGDAARFEAMLVRRGLAMRNVPYSDRAERGRLAQTGLPPARARRSIATIESMAKILEQCEGFAVWDPQERFSFVWRIAEEAQGEPSFRFRNISADDGERLLKWWLRVPFADQPDASDLRKLLRIASVEFEFRLGNAIAATLGVLWQKSLATESDTTTLDDWNVIVG